MDRDTDENTLVTAFERQARLDPRKTAIVDGATEWTFSELSHRVDRIAARLLLEGVAPSTYVALHLRPSADLVASVLAILKVGAAYIPIDSSTPAERFRFIVEDAGVRWVITRSTGLEGVRSVHLEGLRQPGDDHTNALQPAYPLIGKHAHAYVIYTSGSTGKPKGVICTHHNVMRLLSATEERFDFSENDRWTLFHSIAFDFSVWEVFGALLYGGTLVIVGPDVARDTLRFARLLAEQRITVLNQTPSAFYNLVTAASSHGIDCFSGLRYVVLGGERVQCAKLARWFEFKANPLPKLINMYGITETTVHVTYRELTEEDVHAYPDSSPIGMPLRDLSVHLLDDNLNPVPNGDPGEICVAGPGVSNGYLARPELTAQRFVANPFDGGQSTLYRSGDFGRRQSGELFYIGRSDRQVKIRGYRIELGEIERALLAEQGVAASHVMALEAGTPDARLAAYIIPDEKIWPGALTSQRDALLQQLHTSLPHSLPPYMIPNEIHLLSELPLTINGKIDEQKLAERQPDRRGPVSRDAADSLEQQVKAIWLDVLKLKEIDFDVSLEDTGAHSLAAVMIGVRLYKAFGVEIPPKELRNHASIASVARKLREHPIRKPGHH